VAADVRRLRLTGVTVRAVNVRKWIWALPWMLFLGFPVADLITTPRPVAVQVVAGVLLAVFVVAYVTVFAQLGCPSTRILWRAEVVVAALGVGLAVWLGPSWSGLLIYVSAALAVGLPWRWVWPAVVGAAGVCAAVIAAQGLLGELFFLPILCVLTAFALLGTRHLLSLNSQLVEARDELARNAVAEERVRFARDLHDLLGHSLSLIALKSELAGRLAERDPARAREEMADVESVARRALAEVRDAVSGYRQVSFAQALVEARSALSAAGVSLRAPSGAPSLPVKVDAVLGWVIREATTNVLRHSRATSMSVELVTDARHAALTVTDDGVGGDAPAGAGLAGLTERVEAVGGRLVAGAAGHRGFRLAADVPLSTPVAPERVAAP
jgi:two-component system sensor histidine kinase DesK